MKTTMFFTAITISLFAVGCQNSDSLSPTADPPGLTAPLDKQSTGNAVYLPLTGVVFDPVAGSVEISGGIEVYISGQALLDITLRTSAELTPFNRDPVPWYIVEKSTDRIKLPAGASFSLEKAYKIAARQDGAKLRVIIMISRDGRDQTDNPLTVQLAKLYLDVPQRDSVPDAATN